MNTGNKRISAPAPPPHNADVAIVVTSHNYARFLGDALASIAAQTVPAAEIFVIDDGSDDNPAEVTRKFPAVRLVETDHQGISAARNQGLRLAVSPYILFLDADDVLRPDAIAAGLDCMAANRGAGFVYGAHRLVNGQLGAPQGPRLKRSGPLAYRELLRDNLVGMHGTVLYDREKLLACGGFDPALERSEDYDAYLRMARRFRIASHAHVVADYRQHGGNLSLDAAHMLRWTIRVHDAHRPPQSDGPEFAAWRAGSVFWKNAFANSVWKNRGAKATPRWSQRVSMMRSAPRTTLMAALRQLAVSILPGPVADALRRVRRKAVHPRIGQVDFGDLARIAPVSRGFGYARGTPVDRYYIEAFLARHRADIRGRVLEVGDDHYSRLFGEGITRQDVLNLAGDYPGTTITGDLAEAGVLKPASFDCIIITQTLQYIYDLPAGVAQLKQALKPGGVILATAPAITPIDCDDWGENWFWSFTAQSARRLFGDAFGPENVAVSARGNAFAATCFLQGIAVEEVGPDWLDPDDAAYPVNITIRAVHSA